MHSVRIRSIGKSNGIRVFGRSGLSDQKIQMNSVRIEIHGCSNVQTVQIQSKFLDYFASELEVPPRKWRGPPHRVVACSLR